MTKEKLTSLEKYITSLKNRLSDKTPEKHKDHQDTYRAFLKSEIEKTASTIEASKLEGVK